MLAVVIREKSRNNLRKNLKEKQVEKVALFLHFSVYLEKQKQSLWLCLCPKYFHYLPAWLTYFKKK